MAEKYDFREAERRILSFWKDKKIYKFKKSKKKVYSVDTPPPYISGKMHMGHAFSYSQQDFIVRFRRMFEGSVFYPFGTDDNGLPTERFIEKINNVKSSEIGRTEFTRLCLKTLKEVTPECVKDFIDLGISADYDMYYSTIDEHSMKISQESFIDLLNKKEIYSAEFPMIWCPECQTAIAQAELEDKELSSRFSNLKFKLKDSGEDLLIATTRPELLPACVAVFINPADKRAKKLVGKRVIVPLFGQEIPIIEDKSADIGKGTGILMVCSYGDKFDVEAIQRYNLLPKIVLNKDGTVVYNGMKIMEARNKVLEELKEKNLILGEKEIVHSVNVHDRCGTEIEFIPTKQWFIKVLDKKKKLIEQGRKINWHPSYMLRRYENWVDGLCWDWNISRNRHFGVPIPVWECECGKTILADKKELPIDPIEKEKICPDCGKKADPEKMVLDTWATSSLTPQIAIKLKGADAEIPFSLRPQGHDIIRTWAFYTIVKSLLHEKNIPWKDIIISGNVSTGGEKMSKSKGNVVNPREVMEKFGADAMRFWASGSKLGGDLDYQEQDLIAGRKLVVKLWNASNFVFMNLADFDNKKPNLFEIDKLFLKKLESSINETTCQFKKYEYNRAKELVEDFFWNDFCDNYLEIVKTRVYKGEEDEKKSAQYTLYHSLLKILKLFAPFIPFITEEIYQKHFKKFEKTESIHLCKWPKAERTERESKSLELFYEVLSLVRQEKTKRQKAMNCEIVLTLRKDVLKKLENMLKDLGNVTCAREIKEGKDFGIDFL